MKQVMTQLTAVLAAVSLYGAVANAGLPQLDRPIFTNPGVGKPLDGRPLRPNLTPTCPDGWRVQSRSGKEFTCAPVKPRIQCPEGTNYFESGCNFGCSSLI